MLTAQAKWTTENGSKYLQQLCKHFAHKIEVTFSETEGRATLPPGPAHLTADATGLWVEVTAQDADGLDLAKAVIDSHLKRFAFREGFETMPWEG